MTALFAALLRLRGAPRADDISGLDDVVICGISTARLAQLRMALNKEAAARSVAPEPTKEADMTEKGKPDGELEQKARTLSAELCPAW